MFDIIYLILCILSLINIKIKGVNSFFEDYIDLNNTNCIKGIFVWMIFFRHFLEYSNKKKGISIFIDNCFGQNIVSLFLFYSGYGINESFIKKGNNYIKTLPLKALTILIKSELIILLFLFNNIIVGIKVSLNSYLYAVIFKNGIGNSYWFVLAIILLYFYSYLSFRLIKKTKYNYIGILLITIICFLHIHIINKYYHPNILISVDTIFCFIIGFFYSYFKFILQKIIMKNDKNYFGMILLFILLYYKCYIYNPVNIYIVSIKNAAFTLIIILISMKIKFNNDFLILLNNHSYSIYLLQRIVMIHIFKRGYFTEHNFIRFFFEFILVILFSCIFDKYFSFIYKKIKDNFKSKSNKHNYNKIILNEEIISFK